ncbi:MAG: hypothetical protein KGJ02_04935 [Verrucomicrobiota bacterium]|nr:hypothetical protein [Verrucomicrobiota bacterium]
MASLNAASAAIDNLVRLMETPGDYQVENGQLEHSPTRGFHKLRRKPSGDFYATIKSDFITRNTEAINAVKTDELRDEAKTLQRLFFESLPSQEYDRKAITVGGALERVLDGRVTALYRDEEDLIDPVSRRRIQQTLGETEFSCRLGVRPEKIDSEYHPVYFLRSRWGERLGVFKQEMPKASDCYGASGDRIAHLAEVASYRLDYELNRFSRTVPFTQLFSCDLYFSGKPNRVHGSYQFYIEKPHFFQDLLKDTGRWSDEELFDANHEVLANRLDVSALQEMEFENLEQFAWLDLLAGNNDHHFRNILVQKIDGKEWRLIGIDNANSFPWCHDLDLPIGKMHPNHWFKWSTLAQAKRSFSKAMVNKIHLTEIEDITEMLKYSFPPKEHLDGKLKTLRDRFKVIDKGAQEGQSLRTIAKNILALTSKPTLSR